MRRGVTATVVLVLFLAGCSDGGGAGEEDPTFDDFGDVDVADDKGVIRGIVIDTTITPVPGAEVKITGTQLNATTNENGAFLFADLEPGTYFLTVRKTGYSNVQSSAEVKAGDEKPPIMQIQLQRLPGTDPRFVPVEWSGFLGCSMRYFIEGRSCPAANTLWPDHDFLVDIELDAVPTYVTSEMVWKSTQQLGGEMSFNLRRPDTNADTIDVEGRSPLFLAMNETLIAEHSNGNRGGFGPAPDYVDLRVIVFTAHLQETEPPCVPLVGCLWGLGVQLEQDFSTYTHIFFNYEPPADWRFTRDSEVPTGP